jgi:tetratricopeptide (TPR) repeat protein
LPVQARQDSVSYRAGKFMQRNRFAVAAVSLLMLTMMGGIAASTWQARRAERRFQEVRKLANTVLFDFHEKIRDLPGTTEAQQLLVETVAGYLDRLVRDSGSDATLEFELAEAYRKVGDAQGDPTGPNRGQTSEALKTYRKALSLAERVYAREPQNGQVRRALIESHYRIGDLELRAGQPTRAISSFETGLRLAEQSYAAGIRDYDDVRLVVFGFNRLGDVQLDTGRVTPALQSFSKAVDIARTAQGPNPDVNRRLVSVAEFRVADAQAARGDLQTALRMYQELMAARKSLAERNPANTQFQRDYARILCYVGDVIGSPQELSFGNLTEATDYYRRAAFSALQISERDPKNARARRDLVFAYRRLARAVEQSDGPQAVTLWREAIALMQPLLDSGPIDREFRYDQSLNKAGLAHALVDRKDFAEARRNLEEALAVLRQLASEDPASLRFSREVARTLRLLGELEEKAGDAGAARERLLEAARLSEQNLAGADGDARVLADAAATYAALGGYWQRRAGSMSAGAAHTAWQDSRYWFDKSGEIWRTWANRAVAGPYVQAHLKEVTLALARCDKALGRAAARL